MLLHVPAVGAPLAFQEVVQVDPAGVAAGEIPRGVDLGQGIDHAGADLEPFDQLVQLCVGLPRANVDDFSPIARIRGPARDHDVQLLARVHTHRAWHA